MEARAGRGVIFVHVGLVVLIGVATAITWISIFLSGNDLQSLTLSFWRLLLLACFLNVLALVLR